MNADDAITASNLIREQCRQAIIDAIHAHNEFIGVCIKYGFDSDIALEACAKRDKICRDNAKICDAYTSSYDRASKLIKQRNIIV